jgi:hypothetical protein
MVGMDGGALDAPKKRQHRTADKFERMQLGWKQTWQVEGLGKLILDFLNLSTLKYHINYELQKRGLEARGLTIRG